jgi:hypothetical protein
MRPLDGAVSAARGMPQGRGKSVIDPPDAEPWRSHFQRRREVPAAEALASDACKAPIKRGSGAVVKGYSEGPRFRHVIE